MSTNKHSVGTLAALLVSMIFAGCVLLTLAYGVRAYRSVATTAQAAFAQSTGLGYVTQKLRAYDAKDSLRVGELGGVDAIYLYEQFEGETYQTVLYVYDGWLCELYTVPGFEGAAEDGARLIEAKEMTVQMLGGGLAIDYTGEDGQTVQGVVTLHAGGAA